jgi:predicted alpha/beta superfamily hydrolase
MQKADHDRDSHEARSVSLPDCEAEGQGLFAAAAAGSGEPLCLPGARTLRLTAGDGGLSYQIFVSVPNCQVRTRGFPVIFVLDANADFITVSETVRRASRRPEATGIMPAIVVGIGYPGAEAYDQARRYFDFTASPASPVSGDDAAYAYGGQARFIRFLQRDLIPHLEARFPVDIDRKLLMGHSLAGYFALEVLARQPDLFQAYVSLSPSIWWDKEGLKRRLAASCRSGLKARLYVGVGRFEEELAPWQNRTTLSEAYHALRAQRRMVGNARDLVDGVAASKSVGDSICFEIGEKEDHATVFTTLLCRGLRFAQP